MLINKHKACIDWVVRTRRSLSRPPSYNTVSKPPRYSLCGMTPASPTSLYSNPEEAGSGFPDPPSYSQVGIINNLSIQSTFLNLRFSL